MGHYTDQADDNLLGLTDKRLLNEAEALGVFRAEAFLRDLEAGAELTPELLLTLHRTAFGHRYEWAGQWRTSTPNVGAYLPPTPAQVPTLTYQFLDEIRHRRSLLGDAGAVVHLLAYAHHRLVAIHPFTNGNGRMARLLTNLLANQLGYQNIRLYTRETGGFRSHYLTAIRQADAHDYAPLEALISPQLLPL